VGNRQVRRKPYDRGHDPDDWGEREEWTALLDADFEGIPREALIATIHDLARRLLDRNDHASAEIDS
jgi:hypothetical protein